MKTGVEIGMVLEQALGHATHAMNLRSAAEGEDTTRLHFFEVPYEMTGPLQHLPGYGNWSVRASLRARTALSRIGLQFQALYFHTQVTSLASIDLMKRVPTVLSLDATPINYDSLGAVYSHKPAGFGPVDRFAYWLNRTAFRAAKALVSWSDWAKKSLVEDYGVPEERVTVIPPGVPIPSLHDRIDRKPNDPTRVLFVGGDFERKGGRLLLEAYRQRLRGRAELHLVTRSAVEPEPGVHVYRNVSANSSTMTRLFAESDVFALPTLGDTLGIVLLEAAAAGLPVVSTRVAAIPEVVQDGVTGLLVPPADPQALGDALVRLVEDDALRTRLGAAGRARAERDFDARRNAGRVLDVVRSVALAA